MKIIKLLVVAVIMFTLAFIGANYHRHGARKAEPVVAEVSSEKPAGYVAPSTNEVDVTEAALNKLGFTTTNAVGISVK